MTPLHLPPAGARPALSICIPTWNRRDHLAGQLSAILPHLGTAIELVVVENGSTDGTPDLLLDIAARHPEAPLSFWSNGTNLGADVNYLRALEMGRGDWLWLLGDDDDAFDFACLPAFVAALAVVETGAALIHHPGWALADRRFPRRLDVATLMRAEYDVPAHAYLHIGLFVFARRAALSHLRAAYAGGIGDLHAFAVIGLAILAQEGAVTLIDVPAIFDRGHAPREAPRWNAVTGHVGAWQATEAGLPAQIPAVRRRENRLRAPSIIKTTLLDLAHDGRTHPGIARWMVRRFRARYGVVALGLGAANMLPRRLNRSIFGWISRRIGIAALDRRRNDDY